MWHDAPVRLFLVLTLVLVPTLAHADKSFNAGKGGTWDCAKDPQISIQANSGTYAFKGTCKTVNVNGNANKITIETTGQLNVMGNDNKVDAVRAEGVHAMGNHNVITVKSGSPRIANIGNDNKISGGNTPTTRGVSTASGSGATTIDCARQPRTSITSGNGTYTFTGTCDKISVTGGSNTLAVEAVKALSIAGSKNTVEVAAADKIVSTGSDNTVRYKRGLTGAKPKITTLGQHNTVEQTK